VATPIGNLEDITYRAVRVLREVDLIAAEDTRRARVLLQHYGIDAARRVVSNFVGNEARRGEQLVERLLGGASVALISEAGMPGISDPGARLVGLCLERGVAVDVIPGPSAALAALVLSGLPMDTFAFFGFLPRGGQARRRALEALARQGSATLVLYEAPGRVGGTLADLCEALGDRTAAVARELTKLHQEVARGPLSELAARYRSTPPRGEVTLVVGGAADDPEELSIDEAALAVEVDARLARGATPREIAAELAAHGKRRVYQLALARRAQGPTRDE
jgi:16S rRNA (cytidine1402-2'-O)-methyltransferase